MATNQLINIDDLVVAYSPGFLRSPPSTGTEEILQSYSKVPWLYAVVSKIATSVGSVEWKVHTVLDENGQRAVRVKWAKLHEQELLHRRMHQFKQTGRLVEIQDHPIIDFLVDGNDYLLGQTIVSLTEQYLSLVGEAFWYVERDELGVPKAPWPIPPHWIRNVPTRENPFYKIRIKGKEFDVPRTEIIPFLRPDPHNPYGRGVGYARALGDEIESDEYAAKHIKTFFYNRARPDLIVTAERLRPEDTARFEEEWLKKAQGFEKAFKPLFLNRSVDIKEIGQSFESMQLVELRKFERDLVLQVFGVSPEKFGVLTASNRSTIVASEAFWQKDIIKPRIQLIRNTLQKFLVPMFDDRLILDFQSPVVEDKELELKVMQSQPAAFTVNEWRNMANKPPIEGGDDLSIVRPGETIRPIDQLTEESQQQQNQNAQENEEPNNQASINPELVRMAARRALLKRLQAVKAEQTEK